MALRNKQRMFIEAYLQSWNATQAAIKAGYSEKTAYSIGHENLSKPEIAKEIKRRIDESAMTTDEVLARLAKQARASMEDFVSVIVGANLPQIDWEAAQEAGALDSLKKITIEEGKISFELYDKQAALVHLGKHLGLFKERLDITSDDDKLGLTINIGKLDSSE